MDRFILYTIVGYLSGSVLYVFYQIWQSTTSIGAMHRMGVDECLFLIDFEYILVPTVDCFHLLL